jgi:hypothetical protein
MKNKLLTIDSTLCTTTLCELGVEHPTDKSPINTNPSLHKHAYTAIYSLLFSSIRHKPIKLAEIGIYHNMSMCCWRKFFPQATLYGLEFNKGFIDNAVSHNLNNTHYSSIDVTNKYSILAAFDQLNTKLDIIIDDSTHQPLHQMNVIESCLGYLNSGGYLIIEDLFKRVDMSSFIEALNTMQDTVADYFFIDANHKNRFSAEWDNDRLLIIIRK